MSKDIAVPYTAEELLELAAMEATRRNIPERFRDDAIQEYVMAALEAGKKGGRNPRGHQFIRGRGAMMNYFGAELRAERAVPPECSEDAARLSFDAPVPGMDGEEATLAEVIADPDAVIPGDEPPCAMPDGRMEGAMALLTPEERDIAMRIWVQEQTQDEAAADLSIHRSVVRRRLDSAKKIITEYFSANPSLR